MKKLTFVIFIFSVLVLSNCGAVRTTKSGYRIKGEVSQTILTDEQLNGKCKVSGFVYSRNDSTFLSGASIYLAENLGTTTNIKGEFELELSSGMYFVKTNYIGHDELEISELQLKPNQHAILIFELGTSAIY